MAEAEAEDAWDVYENTETTFGMAPWLELAPSDTAFDLPAFCLVDPAKHVPVKSTFLGEFYRWGLDSGEDSRVFEASCRRTLDATYKDSPSPEKQYVGYLMERKAIALKDEAVMRRAAELRECFLTLRIALVVVDDAVPRGQTSRLRELQPRSVWRQVRVRGNLTLRQLHELCLSPTMGWRKGHHGYIFTDAKTDGAQWGPKDCAFPDLANLDMYGYDFLDDRCTEIGQVLKEPDDYILYDYDLLEQFLHRVTLEHVTAPAIVGHFEESPTVTVLDGEMACPPEDSKGLPISGSLGHDGLLQVQRGSAQYKGICRVASEAANVKHNLQEGIFSYDPYRFCLKEANKRVLEASGDLDRLLSGLVLEGSQGAALAADRCAHCGSRQNLMQCTRCKLVQYCSKECQKSDWKMGHKHECSQDNSQV